MSYAFKLRNVGNFSQKRATLRGRTASDAPRLFPVPYSLFPVPCSLFPVPCSPFPDQRVIFGFGQSKENFSLGSRNRRVVNLKMS
jgi:hypothetical protein